MSRSWQRKWQEVLAQSTCTCTFVLALLYLHCRERWGKGGPIALATRHAINFLQQFIHLHIIHLSLHLHILRVFFHQWVKFKKKYRHFSWGYGCPQNNHGAFTYCPNFSHSRLARNFWSKRLIFNPSVHIMDGKMAMAESMACMSNHLAICRRILHVRSNPMLGVFREDGKIIMAFSTRRRTFPSKGHFKLYLDQKHLFFAQKSLMAG